MNPEPPYWLQWSASAGDALSGLFTLATFVLALWVAAKTVPDQLRQFRQSKREEKRAEVAERVWLAVMGLVTALQDFTNPFTYTVQEDDPNPPRPGEQLLKLWEPKRHEVVERSNRVVEVWGLAELYLAIDVVQALKDLWHLRARILVALQQQSDNLDTFRGEPVYPEAYETLHGKQTRDELERFIERLKSLLSPYALLDDGPRGSKGGTRPQP